MFIEFLRGTYAVIHKSLFQKEVTLGGTSSVICINTYYKVLIDRLLLTISRRSQREKRQKREKSAHTDGQQWGEEESGQQGKNKYGQQ